MACRDGSVCTAAADAGLPSRSFFHLGTAGRPGWDTFSAAPRAPHFWVSIFAPGMIGFVFRAHCARAADWLTAQYSAGRNAGQETRRSVSLHRGPGRGFWWTTRKYYRGRRGSHRKMDSTAGSRMCCAIRAVTSPAHGGAEIRR